MDWTETVDAYCERLAPGLWAEPLNALSNAAFLLAALVMWARLRGHDLPPGRALCAALAAIGITSGLWHVLAVAWAGALDVLSILVFILIYLYAANRAFWGLSVPLSLLGVGLFFPWTAALVPLLSGLPLLGASAGYLPVLLLIALYALLLRARAPDTARGLAIGAAILLVSLILRSLDEPLCAGWPSGTHVYWHLLNGLMLGWMIEVYRRHAVGQARTGVA
jgi:hypothetical protein